MQTAAASAAALVAIAALAVAVYAAAQAKRMADTADKSAATAMTATAAAERSASASERAAGAAFARLDLSLSLVARSGLATMDGREEPVLVVDVRNHGDHLWLHWLHLFYAAPTAFDFDEPGGLPVGGLRLLPSPNERPELAHRGEEVSFATRVVVDPAHPVTSLMAYVSYSLDGKSEPLSKFLDLA